MYWDKRQHADFYKQAIKPWGPAWAMLGRDIQLSILHARAFAICRMQARDSVDVEAMDELAEQMEQRLEQEANQ